MLFENASSPIQEVMDDLLEKQGVRLLIKRDDLLHPEVSGNKFRKLKYNLKAAKEEGANKLLTFGGAYSNHISATAAAGAMAGFSTIGIIRGEEHLPLNPTLRFAVGKGMQLDYMERSRYRDKDSAAVIGALEKKWGEFFLIPEGGANQYGLVGCKEIMKEVEQAFDFVAVACGTGTTLAGLTLSLKEGQKALGFPVLKNGAFLADEIQKMGLEDQTNIPIGGFELFTEYHFGGYAKVKPELLSFIDKMQSKHGLPLDPVYTGKLFFGLFDLIEKGFFPKGTTVLALHTGGLQGIAGMQSRGLM